MINQAHSFGEAIAFLQGKMWDNPSMEQYDAEVEKLKWQYPDLAYSQEFLDGTRKVHEDCTRVFLKQAAK